MSRIATRTGPGTARSPFSHRRTVRMSLSSSSASCACVMPRLSRAARNSSGDNEAIIEKRQIVARKHLADRPHGCVHGEHRGGQIVPAEIVKRQALGATVMRRDEADCVRGPARRDVRVLAHGRNIGPLARACQA